MANTKILRKLIRESGLKYGYVADEIGLSYNSLSRKINNESEFKASEIQMLCEILHIKSYKGLEEIFFTNERE